VYCMTHPTRRAWLIAGAVTGCALAAIQILHDLRVPVRFLPSVAARVNGREIDRSSVDRTVAGFDDRLRKSEASARERVLTRMIDEELLVQHALDSGAAETDPEVRAALVRAAINRVNSEVAAESIPADEIEAFYAARRSAYASRRTHDAEPTRFKRACMPVRPSRRCSALPIRCRSSHPGHWRRRARSRITSGRPRWLRWIKFGPARRLDPIPSGAAFWCST
jgi:hypothetical protein